MKFKYLFLIFIVLQSNYIYASEFKEKKSEHFIIYYSPKVDEYYVHNLIDKFESYYRLITNEFNLIRDKLWLWENRAKIYVSKDKEEYLEKFKCPHWSSGCVNYYEKIIYTYLNQENFNSIFVHELTHIIFREYVGEKNLPVWLDEGIATYMETKYASAPYQRMTSFLKSAIRNNRYIKFSELPNFYAIKDASKEYVELFYLESFSIISFLINNYPKENFRQFLYFLKNGYNLEEALRKSFYHFRSLDDLERAWKKYYSEN